MKHLKKFLLYYNTIKFLKFSQIFNRFTRKFHFDTERTYYKLSHNKVKWNNFIPKSKTNSTGNTFYFLNEKGVYSDWGSKSKSLLWLYNLHYFDDLNRIGSDRRLPLHEKMFDDWISKNPYRSSPGWEPYPLSLRIVNLVKWLSNFESVDDRWLNSLADQTNALYHQLEVHLGGNHLFANGKALLFSSAFLNCSYTNKWLEKGFQIISRELQEQVLDDGANYELSPMYHNIFIEDILDIYQLLSLNGDLFPIELRQPLEQDIKKIAPKMLNWSLALSHPDGEIGFFNDAAFSVAPKFNELKKFAEKLGLIESSDITLSEGLNYYSCSGFVRFSNSLVDVIIDLAEVGPDCIPGHAHADTLSFEMSIKGRRVFVNSGTSEYGSSEQRNYERSTRAHNTVEVNSTSSSEVWGGFRVARRASVKVNEIKNHEDNTIISASHNGYRILSKPVIHSRIYMFEGKKVTIDDSLQGAACRGDGFLYLNPDISLSIEENDIILSHDEEFLARLVFPTPPKVISSFWSPEFGRRVENNCIIYRLSKNRHKFEIVLE